LINRRERKERKVESCRFIFALSALFAVNFMSSFLGHLHLTAAQRDDGQTAIAEQSFRAPFHLSKPYWDGHVLQVQVVNPTAGVLEGDELELDVRVRSGAALVVTTPAATRAFMMRRGVAVCRQQLTVDAGGWLEFAPEPLCPHRDCDYTQATRLDVTDGGEVCFVDALAPGRVGRGERWAWRRLRLGLEVWFGGEPVLIERLDGSGADMARAAAFFGTPDAWMATMVVLTQRITTDDPVWAYVRSLHGDGRWVGVTRLRRGGWIVRTLAPGGQELRDLLRAVREALAELLPSLRSNLRKL
jgi:urease accessory protein